MNLYDPNLLETISFNTTKGAPAKLDAASPWMYYNEETGYYERIYKNDDARIVKAGVRYAYATQLRIDGVDYETNAEMIKQAQRTAIMRDPTMAAATLVGAQADAMKAAASNEGGAMNGFIGMGMAMNAGGMNAQNLFAMGQQQTQQTASSAPDADGWKCACGATATGKFCPECGSPKPAEDGWACSCGTVNKGKFCQNCGARKPEGAPLYRCDKCGWEPEDPHNPPKFCPECGDLFDDNDKK